jgi:hypothetical protein
MAQYDLVLLVLPLAVPCLPCHQVCFGAVLDALSRGDGPALSMRLATSRRALVDLLPALASDSYGRAYPSLLKLHMLQEIQDVAGLMHQVAGWGSWRGSGMDFKIGAQDEAVKGRELAIALPTAGSNTCNKSVQQKCVSCLSV